MILLIYTMLLSNDLVGDSAHLMESESGTSDCLINPQP